MPPPKKPGLSDRVVNWFKAPAKSAVPPVPTLTGPVPPGILVGEPARAPVVPRGLNGQRICRERLAALSETKREEYEGFKQLQVGAHEGFQSPSLELSWGKYGFALFLGGRKNQEDRISMEPALGLSLVADGMGGHAAGEVASRTLAETFQEYTHPDQIEALAHLLNASRLADTIPNRLAVIAREAHRRIQTTPIEGRDPTEKNPGTTLSGSLIEGNTLFVFNQGDSFTVVVRKGKVVYCTRPKNVLQMAAERLKILPGQAHAYFKNYFETQDLKKLAQEFPTIYNTDRRKMASQFFSDPGPVLGIDGESLDVESVDLQDGDAILSFTDGAAAAFGLEVVPSRQGPDGRWQFNPEYPTSTFFYGQDPFQMIGESVGQSVSGSQRRLSNRITDYQHLNGGADNAAFTLAIHAPEQITERVPDLRPRPPTLPPPVPTSRPRFSEPPPIPPPEDPRIGSMKQRLAALAEEQSDFRLSGDAMQADVALFKIWDIQDRLFALTADARYKRKTPELAEVRRVRLNVVKEGIPRLGAYIADLESEYSAAMKEQAWDAAARNLQARHEVQIDLAEATIDAAWYEGRFADILNRDLVLTRGANRETARITGAFPADDAEAPNMVVITYTDPTGKPVKRQALPAHELSQKYLPPDEVSLDVNRFPIQATDFTNRVNAAIRLMRIHYDINRIAQKLAAKEFEHNPPLRDAYTVLRNLLEKPVIPTATDLASFGTWATEVGIAQEQVNELLKPKK